MLDVDTKRRIDTARDILVGKVPDPKSQVEQITIALIYKFMDDLDAESEELGGDRSFFAGDFSRYGWAKLMHPSLGGYETLNLYAEAITRMPENPGIPPLFRDIFNNAYLPYRDPETLRAFLKVIDEFTYDHSERLGDAFEYLLSVLGAQGDAGQFRTPRHIIDFIVAVVDPKKSESVLDPACGTGGFLISAYKHIVAANIDANGQSTLTPDDRGRLVNNFKGYDISPDMVRLSLVNMYLHGFREPHIYEYDTLTSDERWNEYADVILANPPFMSPRGGIRPHNRFSVQSKRSEVLFVDYMAEHLSPEGRAGIIVPEGIIFQSQTAYKQLRKMLVEDYLVAVVSLPAGVFNPYSGVKTSILILDRALAKRTDSIAFFKVENDGFELGAQRRPTDRNDLPRVQTELCDLLYRRRAGHSVSNENLTNGIIVDKERIAEYGEYNLSGERYREVGPDQTDYEWTELGNVILGKPQYGSGARKVPYDGTVRYVRITDIADSGVLKNDEIASPSIIEPDLFLESGDLLIARSGSVGRTYIHKGTSGTHQYAGYLIRFRIDRAKALSEYVYHVTRSRSWRNWIVTNSKTGTLTNINAKQYSSFRFPLPPLEVQREIVAEIGGYQRVIDGARAVVENYRPHIVIDPEWPMVGITDLVTDGPYSIKAGPFGSTLKKECYVPVGYKVYGQEQVIRGDVNFGDYYITQEKYDELESCKVEAGDVLVSLVGTYGKTLIVPSDHEPGIINPRLVKITLNQQKIIAEFLVNAFTQEIVLQQIHGMSHGGTMNILSVKTLKNLRLPLPPLEIQRAIVKEIQSEQTIIEANRDLIERFKGKIHATIGRVWGEGASAVTDA